jgi:hypothetical protein
MAATMPGMADKQQLTETLTNAIDQLAKTAPEATSYAGSLEAAQAAQALADALKTLGLWVTGDAAG